MLATFLVIIHVIVCVILIMVVLLQSGKGADIGAVFGGGASQTLFGSSGASNFLSKATTAAAIIFMITSLGLSYFSSNKAITNSSIMKDVKQDTKPADSSNNSNNNDAQSQSEKTTGTNK